ncbi:hypothetical protein H8E65_04825, partial [Candidatus Bathyarchaeota archaeon]|nr:hypothetical protein [Candidatus Bathyarchaeota archaeon]
HVIGARGQVHRVHSGNIGDGSVAAGRTVSEALQIFGGYGFIAEYDIERIYRDVRVTELYEGTTEIQKNMVARFLLRGE